MASCNNPDPRPSTIDGKVWLIRKETGLSTGDRIFPISLKGDFDRDGTEEHLEREDLYVFEEAWCHRGYRLRVLEDEGEDKESLQKKHGVIYSGAGSPYTLRADSINLYGHWYKVKTGNSSFSISSKGHYQAVFEQSTDLKALDVINAPVEPD
ncbi:hypothetical protein GCM10028791_17050 [Echinicola sediminis]